MGGDGHAVFLYRKPAIRLCPPDVLLYIARVRGADIHDRPVDGIACPQLLYCLLFLLAFLFDAGERLVHRGVMVAFVVVF